jgi:thiamine pyrophosphokinase
MYEICYIIGAAPIEAITLHTTASDFVITADAGYLHLAGLSVAADLVVGDFDSLGFIPSHPNVITYPREKDKTDMLLAIDEGLRRNYKTFVLLGGLGGRLDHTYANIQTLSYIAQNNARGFLLGGGTAVTVIKNDVISFKRGNTGILSVFCCDTTARGVMIHGLKYELNNAVVTGTYPIGVSNEFTGVKSEISVKSGSLMIMWEDNAAAIIDNIKQTCYRAEDLND